MYKLGQHAALVDLGLVKEAKRQASLRQMIDYIRPNVASRLRFGGAHTGPGRIEDLSPDKIKQVYRSMLRNDSATYFVPLEDRLKVYKHWKRHGELPGINHPFKEGKTNWDRWELSNERFFWDPSKELVEIASGGPSKGFERMMRHRRPVSGMNSSYLLPGQTHTSSRGLYAVPGNQEAYAAQYSNVGRVSDSALAEGQPAIATMKVPRRHMAVLKDTGGNMGEITVPSHLGDSLQDVSIKKFRDRGEVLDHVQKLEGR
jgi:hypothetical protein